MAKQKLKQTKETTCNKRSNIIFFWD